MKNKILFTVPTELELSPIIPLLEKRGIPWTICGIGPVETAFTMTKTLLNNHFNLVILAGIAGIYPGYERYFDEIFLAKTEILADLARCSQSHFEPISIKHIEISRYFDLYNYLSKLLEPPILNLCNIVDMATVSCVSASVERAKFIQQFHGAVVENMEGASVAFVCKKFHLGLIEIRTISNIAGETDKSKWKIDEALNRLAQAVEMILNGLNYERVETWHLTVPK